MHPAARYAAAASSMRSAFAGSDWQTGRVDTGRRACARPRTPGACGGTTFCELRVGRGGVEACS
ncbi:hypothetical protein LA76x_3242 [Lysobacter antibioticus]|uniref:Uncharacterized protein n=1 Tax=Lysobacter antibioticus TaxID=84531 RepID=A0A0S2FCU2_LYSAN|nr:hypothetical protein LA76x_3242 [Lysobacter antibioticus]